MEALARPRLNRTLKRYVEFKTLDDNDMRWIWGAYRMSALADFDEKFAFPTLSPEEFRESFAEHFNTHFTDGWMFNATTDNVWRPVGLCAAMSDSLRKDLLDIRKVIWFPWATKRTIVESAVNFFNSLRKRYHITVLAQAHDKRFFEHIAKHGIMRRVGTLHDIYDKPASLFQTKKPG